MTREEAIELALDLVEEGEFGTFWREVDREDFEVVSCEWEEPTQDWIVKIRGWCPDDGGAWLMYLSLNQEGDVTGSIWDVED